MREPGFEPGSPRWQRDILTTELFTLIKHNHSYFLKLIISKKNKKHNI